MNRLSKLAATSFVTCIVLAGPGAAAEEKTQAELDRDPLLAALVAEADRTSSALKGKGDAPLYYLSYRVHDGVSFRLNASYGAMSSIEDSSDPLAGRVRTLDVAARAGTAKLDSTHKIRRGRFEFDFGDRDYQMGRSPIEDDPESLRLSIWRATDHTCKRAVKKLIEVRTNKAVKVNEEDDAPDFTQPPAQVHVEPRQNWTLDRKAWAEKLRHLSAAFKDHPRIIKSDVALDGGLWTTYFVDTDGARIRQPQSFVRIMLSASAKADDGMDLDLFRDFEAISPEGLPKDEELKAAVDELIARLEALRVAPVVDPYSGPAIIANRAAAVYFHEIFGHRIEGHRQKDADEGHTFTHKLGQQVVPPFISVTDDPTVVTFHEKNRDVVLNGHYAFDDEGIAAQRVSLVDKGVLKGFLMGRSPIHGFADSNGHGRAQAGLQPVSRQGNLLVKSSSEVPFAVLREKLIQEVKKQGKPYGLIFQDISGGFTTTQAGRMPQAFKVMPLVVERVYPDGRPDELVRGVDMIGTPLESFEKILTTGDDYAVFNGYCGAESGWVPVSAAAPSLLIGELEVERRAPNHDRPPLLPPPLHVDAPWPPPSGAARPGGAP